MTEEEVAIAVRSPRRDIDVRIRNSAAHQLPEYRRE
jgi:hypothetical protein